MTWREEIIGDARLICCDALQVLPTLGPVDSVVVDPPYHLQSIVKRFGKIDIDADNTTAKRLRNRSDGAARLARGFMNTIWDGGDIAFDPETWRLVLGALKPGGYLLAFGGARTHHRIWCAIEDAGFVIQDTIMWLYGQGFPKGRTQLKPAVEPICLAYKPGGKRELQIDGCRVEGTGNKTFQSRYAGNRSREQYRTGTVSGAVATDLGRWPANVCHDGSDEVMEAFPDAPGQLFATGEKYGPRPTVNCYGDFGPRPDTSPRGDTGSAARFFYCAKASKTDRAGSKHPTIKPQALMRWLVTLVTPPGGTVLDCFAGSGSTGQAALAIGRKAILIEREAEYFEDCKRRLSQSQSCAEQEPTLFPARPARPVQLRLGEGA